ncbi:MAG: hypothetical protein H0W72_12325, partial [Planctomycetes bacterium]|nr:hypothetical protein [Planctomycetota bacterium]
PARGDTCVCIAQFAGKPVAVLMRPVDPGAPAGAAHTYVSPVMPHRFDRVEAFTAAKVAVKVEPSGYLVEVALPLAALGLKPTGLLRGDVGIISSDAAGLINVARTYWSNQHTNLVNDLPQEAWFEPSAWGDWSFR